MNDFDFNSFFRSENIGKGAVSIITYDKAISLLNIDDGKGEHHSTIMKYLDEIAKDDEDVNELYNHAITISYAVNKVDNSIAILFPLSINEFMYEELIKIENQLLDNYLIQLNVISALKSDLKVGSEEVNSFFDTNELAKSLLNNTRKL